MTVAVAAAADVTKSQKQMMEFGPAAEAGAISIPRTGLDLPNRLPYEKWVLMGRLLSTVHASSAWCLGDWLLHGETAYNGRYREAIENCSLNYQTLRNYAWVARRFPLSRRRDALSFGHHAEVASLADPEQDYWLRKAEDHGWSRNRLRAEVRASLNERAEAADTTADGVDGGPDGAQGEAGRGGGIDLQLEITADRVKLWRAAAEQASLSVSDWALRALDEAARTA
ncbi:LmbU family transcriptional regulator [Kitasatospora sp. RG8]|uniref:LmbU family transcriptional regulator n=1 Tax=Kitasatospora sp. RG8 TaxID=2820815 RepID=UPI001FD822D3|nr:LmbU family transcriptional regulator [Kitasatospora sp. RG8]